MRAPADADLLGRFMAALGREAERDTRLYFTGGAGAVLLGWRPSTLDADIEMVPESDALLRAIPRLKFAAIEPELYRYPALDAARMKRALEEALAR